MTSPSRNEIEDLRERLALEFARSAEKEGTARPPMFKRARFLAAAAVVIFAIPAGLAVAGVIPGSGEVVEWDGEQVTRNGEVLTCPVDDEVIQELTFDPCRLMTPAPAPRSEQER